MKATSLDYLLSTLAILTLLAGALAVVSMAAPWLQLALGAYHVVVAIGLGLMAYGVLAAIGVRLLLKWRPIPEGTFDADSPEFTRWKLVTVVYRTGQAALRPFVPFFMQPALESLFGARMGTNVALGGTIDDPYAVTVGDGTVLGNASLVAANFMEGGRITFGKVVIGKNVTIGANSVVFPSTEIGDGSVLMVGSCLMPGTRVPPGQTWRGNPARKWQ